ncbi:DNA phosphorothioation system sulfurtransferase DndC [Clostridium thermobutyricum]|uniref:DNA phosphorothioation system sulfurtransferase DndC n=1 Tax=Clostridium thermobutyricum TaxID=29372 RepID=UPI003F5288B9
MQKLNFKTKINYILEEMQYLYENDNRPWIIGYSGGKDSTVVVQLVYQMLLSLPKAKRKKPVHIVSSDTLIENPIVLHYLKETSNLIGNSAKNANLPIYTHIVAPEANNSYWANIIGKGLPTPTSIRFRWCTERLKIQPSNKFIESQVAANGEVIILLGVRKAESIARKNRIENREIDGYLLTPHVTLSNTYVYNPIVDLTTNDVWELLLENNGINPWNGDNNELFRLYMGSDAGECPFTITKDESGNIDTPSCGNSRFGCWICTVVKEDKSLTGFRDNGEEWLQPLLDFREWILSIRNKHEYRLTRRRDGNHYYKKIYIDKYPINENGMIDSNLILENEYKDKYILPKKYYEKDIVDEKDKLFLELLPLEDQKLSISKEKIKTDNKGRYINVIGYGPFNFFARKEILKRLLETQKEIGEDLITLEELKAIDEIWDREEDLSRSQLTTIYYEIIGQKLPWHDFKKSLFDEVALATIEEVCKEDSISLELFNKLLIQTENNKLYSNKSLLAKEISKTLNQKYLHKDIYEELENDN